MVSTPSIEHKACPPHRRLCHSVNQRNSDAGTISKTSSETRNVGAHRLSPDSRGSTDPCTERRCSSPWRSHPPSPSQSRWFEVVAVARSNFRPAVVAGTCAEGRAVVGAGRCPPLVPKPRYKAPWPGAGPDSRGSRQVAHVAGNPAPQEAGKTAVEPAGSRSSWRPTIGSALSQRNVGPFP